MTSIAIRQPAVAGQFYPSRERDLAREVQETLAPGVSPVPGAVGVMLPHAGYVYSGAVAGETISRIEIPARVVLLGPNHSGLGAPISLFPGGAWLMPFGEVPVDDEMVDLLAEELTAAERETAAHLGEHSLEVQLPFLHYRRQGPLRVTPVVLSQLSPRLCREAGASLARAVVRAGEPVLIVASSDMNHYESEEVTQEKDRAALAPLLDLDPDRLLAVVSEGRISMCGVIPVAVMLHAALSLGARRAVLVRHSTSAETSGDYGHVVGYAGVIVSR
jgi:AmmeMemoRadiSam system protein B